MAKSGTSIGDGGTVLIGDGGSNGIGDGGIGGISTDTIIRPAFKAEGWGGITLG